MSSRKIFAYLQNEFWKAKIMQHLGSKYRALRKQEGLSLKEACQGICSVSNLSRWENNLIKLDFESVILLLDKLHLNSTEFLNYNQNFGQTEIPKIVLDALKQDQDSKLENAFKEIEGRYQASKNIYDLYLLLCLANHYFLKTKKQTLLPLKLQIRIFNYLSSVTLWSGFNLSFFANSVFIIQPKKVFAICQQILDNFEFKSDDENLVQFITSLGSLSDATIALIWQGKLTLAQKVLSRVKLLSFPIYLDTFSLVFNFLEELISYKKTADDQPLLQMIDQSLKLGLTSTAEIFVDIYKMLV